MDFDFGLIEGGLAGLITAVASVGKYIHKRLTKDIDDLRYELKVQKEDHGREMIEQNEEHIDDMKEQKAMLNARIDRDKLDLKEHIDKAADVFLKVTSSLTRLETLMEKHYGRKRSD